MPRVGYSAVVVLIGLLSALPTSAGPETGMLCVIPDPPGCRDLVTVPFDLKTLMFRIDNGTKTPWPQKMGFKIEGLSLREKHLVVVYSGGKPIQSFRFRFSDYNKTRLGVGSLSTIHSPEILVALRNTVLSAMQALHRRTTYLDSIRDKPCDISAHQLAVAPGKRGNRPNTYQYFRKLQANCLSPKNKCKDVNQINDVESGRE